MSTRSAAIHTRHTSQRPSGVPVQAAVALNSSSRSSTPTRIHAPRNRGAQNASSEVPPANSTSNNSLPSTPTRKRNTGRKRADARKPRLTDGSDDADTPDEDLMELLGMTSSTPSLPTEKGILSISKAEIDAAEEKTAPPRRTRRQKASEVADLADADTPASSDPEGPRRSRRGKKSTAPADKDQAASASLRNAKGKGAPAAPGDSAGPSMDLSNLSKSLPHSFHSENAKASKNNAAWDMPTEATGGQPLNVSTKD